MSNGEEGCLDLIIESADSVEELAQVDNHLVVAGRLSVTGSRRQQGAAIRRQDAPGPESAAFPPPLVPKAPQLNPGDMRLSSGACNAYMRAHGVDEAEAGKDLRQMLVDFVEIGQLTPRPAGLEDYALDHEGFHLVVSEEAVLHYASLRPDANTWADLRPDGEPETSPVEPVPVDPVADPQTSLPSESSPTATSHEAAVPERGGGRPMTRRKVNLRSLDTFYDRIDPQTLSMTLDAVATATHAFGLGDPYSWEALDGVRQRLANDLATSPTVEQGPLGWTVHGEWAQWLVDHEAGRLVSLKPNGQPLAEPALPPDPDAAATSEAAGSEPEKSATLVDQLERLDVLHSAGVLTDDEFTAAKAQLLF